MRSDLEQPGPGFGRDDEGGDLLEAGDDPAFRPSRWAVAVVVLLVALVAGVPRVLDWRRDRRERAAAVAADNERRQLDAERAAAERAAEADRVRLRVVRLTPDVHVAPPDGRPDDEVDAEIELTFTVTNGAGALQVHDVTFRPIGLPAIPISHPDVIPARGDVDLVATIRVPCGSVLGLDDIGSARLSATVTPASGRQRTIDSLLGNHPLPLTSALRDSCGFQSPWEAAEVFAAFVPSTTDQLTYVVGVRNISRRPLVVEQVSTPGMSVTASVRLPLEVAPGALAKFRTTLRVARCDALGISLTELTDDFDPLLELAVTGVNHESAELVANFSAQDARYIQTKNRLLEKECPLQVHGDK